MVAIRLCPLPPKFLELFSVCIRGRASKSYERKVNLQVIKIDCFRVSAETVCGPRCVNFLLGGGKWRGPDGVSPCPTRLLSAACTSSDLNMNLIHSKSNIIRSSVLPHKPRLWCPITLSGSGPPHGTCDTIFNTRVCQRHCPERTQAPRRGHPTDHGMAQMCGFSSLPSLHVCKEHVSTFRRRGKIPF